MSPITLPDHAPVSDAALRAVAERHGLTSIDGAPVPLTQTGMINAVYALGPHLPPGGLAR